MSTVIFLSHVLWAENERAATGRGRSVSNLIGRCADVGQRVIVTVSVAASQSTLAPRLSLMNRTGGWRRPWTTRRQPRPRRGRRRPVSLRRSAPPRTIR